LEQSKNNFKIIAEVVSNKLAKGGMTALNPQTLVRFFAQTRAPGVVQNE
jgi:hypothetical protein